MIDLHTHTLLSDGVLLPSELVQRARLAGYRALAITDHVDTSNLETVLDQITGFYKRFTWPGAFKAVPGVELTHVPPADIPGLVKEARKRGALVVVAHGETTAEPVEPGTNLSSIEAGADILAHPGLVTDEECTLAHEKGVLFELTARSGHSIANGHVAMMARKFNVGLVVNSDAHGPSDLISIKGARTVALGAGLNEEDFRRTRENAQTLLDKVCGRA